MKKSLVLAAAGALAAGASVSAWADSAVINFTANLPDGNFSGPPELDPYNSNLITVPDGSGGTVQITESALFALVNDFAFPGTPGGQDWLRFAGQIYIPDFAGEGTYTIGGNNSDGGFYLHSPLLNRLEAVSLRTEGPLTAGSIALGAAPADGDPSQNRDDFYFPDFDPNGIATVTISGSDVTINYLLDFSTLDDTNAAFLRNGVTPTQIGDALLAAGVQFDEIAVTGGGSAVVESALIGSGDEDLFPYGAFNPFAAGIDGNLSNTIVPSLRGVVELETAAQNITTDGRLVSDPTTPTEIILNPFLAETGATFFYDLTGAGDLDASVSLVVPEPTSAGLLAGLGLLALRQRRAG
ncbi:MAG: hypothetical protein AAF916_03600 [Planctomycetota bacterium]